MNNYRFSKSNSLKAVLPVITPELSYKVLEVQNGTQAQVVWEVMIGAGETAVKQHLADQLRAYCFAGCEQLERIPTQPPQTPANRLTSQPYAAFTIGGQTVLLMQPTSMLFVHDLVLVAIGIGLRVWRCWNGQRARRWWGVTLMLWGVGALLAGTSYEDLSYHLKCASWAVCR